MSPGNDERRPRQESGATVKRDNTTSIQAQTLPTIDQYGPTVRAIAFAWFDSGLNQGIEIGYAQRDEDDLEAIAGHLFRMIHLHEELERILPAIRKAPTFDQLSDLRGQHGRADRQRQILRERGIAS